MASETESLTIMQAAMQKAGLTSVENAQRVNRIKHSENLKKKVQNKPTKQNNVEKFRENLKNNVKKVG